MLGPETYMYSYVSGLNPLKMESLGEITKLKIDLPLNSSGIHASTHLILPKNKEVFVHASIDDSYTKLYESENH